MEHGTVARSLVERDAGGVRSEGGEFVAQKVGLARDFHQYVGAFRQEEGALDGKGFYGVVVVVFGQDVQQDGVYIRAGLVGDLVMKP